jgi:hypothetical protein
MATRVFLNVQPVTPRRPANASPFTYQEKRLPRWRASWIARGTNTEFYSSKPVATPEDAVRLAKQWLQSENRTRILGPVDTRLIDTTDSPERFGYTHAKKSRAQINEGG